MYYVFLNYFFYFIFLLQIRSFVTCSYFMSCYRRKKIFVCVCVCSRKMKRRKWKKKNIGMSKALYKYGHYVIAALKFWYSTKYEHTLPFPSIIFSILSLFHSTFSLALSLSYSLRTFQIQHKKKFFLQYIFTLVFYVMNFI